MAEEDINKELLEQGKEEGEVAKRKIQPLLGFMCTLDPLGYAPSQYYTVPFLVLKKAIESEQEKKTE